jgi:S1-C subfamily serine protease
MQLLLAALLLLLVCRPALADFVAAEAAERRGDHPEAYEACKGEADAGNAECQNLVGLLFQKGLGVPANSSEALRFFRLAAAKGLAAAQVNLGITYQNGLGVAPDDAQAARWYQLAVAQGDPIGEFNLALLSITGRGVPKDPAKAAELLRHAADRGYTLAQVTLALALESRRSSPRNAVLAYVWYRIAARLTHDNALRSRALQGENRLLVEFSSQEIIASRAATDNWKPAGPQLEFGLLGARPSPPPEAVDNSGAAPKPSATGSGFLVSRAGDFLTNNHVIDGCREVRAIRGAKSVTARVTAIDASADLAIVRLPDPVEDVASFHPANLARPGEPVVVVGFPLQGLLSSEASVATGIISALAGPHDDKKLVQITAPVQPGNSGGPLVDASGAVIGVIVSKLNAVRVAQVTGVIPENINFAVNTDLVRALLDKHGIKYDTTEASEPLATPAIAERALKYTVLVQCYR